MATGVEPDCRYGHGPLVHKVLARQPGEDEGSTTNFFVPSVNRFNINMGIGYSFEIWECQKCSYLELHDSDPDQP